MVYGIGREHCANKNEQEAPNKLFPVIGEKFHHKLAPLFVIGLLYSSYKKIRA
ncbi:hypothetical protein lbkm_1279 [Lachnospiraceae bacterium KM106-2]|nr:hypothetical protein lbkm_1279 [Lachnospiraceae bacterium KM106-2]